MKNQKLSKLKDNIDLLQAEQRDESEEEYN